MNNIDWDEAKFTIYESLLNNIFGADLAFIILDKQNNLIFTTKDYHQLEKYKHQPYEIDLYNIHGEVIGVFKVIVTNYLARKKLSQKIDPILHLCATIISNSIISGCELEEMANELASRYNEINLIYATEKSFLPGKNEHSTIASLLENFVSYIDVNGILLYFFDKNNTVKYINKSPESFSQYLNSSNIKNILIYFKHHKQSIVFNSETEHQELNFEFENKYIISPIMTTEDSYDGMIITTRDLNSKDFTNSDRNLLEVLARKISMISYTHYDLLTGLNNRSRFEFLLEQYFNQAKKYGDTHVIIDIDIDNMRVYNEIVGVDGGNILLKKIAKVLKSHIKQNDIIARIGGDEFAILLSKSDELSGIKTAKAIKNSINELGFIYNEHLVEITVTMGIALIDKQTKHSVDGLHDAEVARDAASDFGVNHIEVLKRDDKKLIQRKKDMQLVKTIKDALRNDKFVLYSHPIASINDINNIYHYEVLIRLRDDGDKELSPCHFLPAAERFQLMPEIDKWVINQVCAQLSKYFKNNHTESINLAINLSGQSVGDTEFLKYLKNKLTQISFDPKHLCFEITESVAISDLNLAKNFINEISSFGCTFSLDDFGTGLSSFTYLKELQVTNLKIDGSFIKNINQDPVSLAMVKAINEVGHVMQLKTIAEFIENEEIINCLSLIGIDYLQGYHINKPINLEYQLFGMN